MPTVVDAPPRPGGAPLGARSFEIAAGATGLAEAIAAALRAKGASVRMDDGTLLQDVDALIDVTPFAPDAAPAVDPVKGLFERARQAVAAGARTVLAVSHLGAPFAAEQASARTGVAGLVRTLAKEQPDVDARSLALDPLVSHHRLAEHVVAELTSERDHVEIGYVDGARKALSVAPAERLPAAADSRVHLGAASVVLVTGGARGITAAVARALARRFGCTLVLCGRSPLPEDAEDAELAAALDLPALRRAIIAHKKASGPAAIEALASKVMAAREIRATLKDLAAAGARADYHAVDVRDAAAFGALIDAIYARHGRIDGVVHGAGVLDDKLLAHKTRDAFDRVFDTKVASARTLAARLRPDVGFIAFFASVSGAFGNRGQIDYSAANDALDKLAWWLSSRLAGKVVSLDWGPWGGAGMISPELAREYERRGVGLIDPVLGAESFLDELLHGGSAPQVVLMNAPLAVMEGRSGAAVAEGE